jgi:hypothetical protein
VTAPRVFGVDYKFLACGDVFTDGLVHAAAELGIAYAHADWNAPTLGAQVGQFAPDLLFVVHGRKFRNRWHLPLGAARTAVWLLDEPYEVDDTSRWSGTFHHVFVNDAATLARHRHASLLPVCADPHVHTPGAETRVHAVGFVGGGNATRDRMLAALAAEGLLTYVVGGSWDDARVKRLCTADNLSARAVPALYQRTRIIVNVWRDRHHFNRDQVPATAMNPRIYEALACGALVVSEGRPELAARVPELPTFETPAELVALVRGLLEDPARAEAIRVQCAARLQADTYAARLQTVLTTVGLGVAVPA